jgi:hypothetical protein
MASAAAVPALGTKIRVGQSGNVYRYDGPNEGVDPTYKHTLSLVERGRSDTRWQIGDVIHVEAAWFGREDLKVQP